PEIIDVATLLNAMGAKIKGAGTETIRIEGVRSLGGCRHSIIPDRIQAGTYMIAAAATRGDVIVDNIIPKHMEAVTAKLQEMGVHVYEMDESIRVVGQPRYEAVRSEEHTSELQSRENLVCRLLLETKKQKHE